MRSKPVSRRKTLTLLLGAIASAGWASRAVGEKSSFLPQLKSLSEQVNSAVSKGQPLVIMVSLEGCPFCHVVRNSYLAPLVRDGVASVVQVDMRSAALIKDVNGKALTHAQLISQWSIRLAPTLLFMGRDGREVAERLVGGDSTGFYGAYLNERLQLATKAVIEKMSKA